MDQTMIYYELLLELLWEERRNSRLLNGELLELRRQQGEVNRDAVQPFDC